MTDPQQILQGMTEDQKKIIQEASEEGAIILFNIKGMIQILRDREPFEFIEMGYEDIEKLKRKGLISPIRTMKQSHVLQGEEYELSAVGKEVADFLNRSL